jgi:hypothetical protein
MTFFRRENNKVRVGNQEKKKPIPEPQPVIAGTPSEPLGLLQPGAEIIPFGMAKVRFLRGAVANQRCYSKGDEAVVPTETANLLRADGRVEMLSLLPPPEREEHPFRDNFIAKMRQRMRRATHNRNSVTDWIYSPIGGKFDAFRW